MKKAYFAALAFLLMAPIAFADLVIGPYVPATSPQLDFTFALDPVEADLATLNEGDTLTTVNIVPNVTDFSAAGWFDGIVGGSFTNLFADQTAKTHVIKLIPGLKEELVAKVKEKNSEDLKFLVYLSSGGKYVAKNLDFKVKGVLQDVILPPDFTFALDPVEADLATLNEGDVLTTVNIETSATDFSASGWFEDIQGPGLTNLFADQTAKAHAITFTPVLREALVAKVKEKDSEAIKFVVYLSANGKSVSKAFDFKVKGVLLPEELKMQCKSSSVQSTPANQGTAAFYKKEAFSILVSGLKDESDKSLFLFRNQKCEGSPVQTVAYDAFKDSKAYNWQSLGWQGVTVAEQGFCACQAKTTGECASASIAYKASMAVREYKAEEDSIVWALAQIGKKLVEGIFGK